MFALVESGSITKIINGNKGITLNNVQYPKSIYTLWSEAERNAIGIYTVEIDDTNKKDEEWYINTNITYAFSGGKVKGTYGTATAKSLADPVYTSQDKTDGIIPDGKDVGDATGADGLKTIKKRIIDNQCAGLLAPSDWMVVKATETGETMDSGWKTWRASVRTKCNSMQTQIDNASDVDALAALYVYTYDSSTKKTTRPLGEFPVKE
jgi:predicted ribonuclease toxin of YeeF-YezG toxin-antitoxin module|tara:strand:- start:19 stop:642 length:624 start_codon:yes stop_codon:yes gene_type:complete